MVSGCLAFAGTLVKSGAAPSRCPGWSPFGELLSRGSQVRVLPGAPSAASLFRSHGLLVKEVDIDGDACRIVLDEENVMTRSGTFKWVGCAIVALLLAGPTASSQSLKPDAHGFLIAAPEDLKPAGGGRSISGISPVATGVLGFAPAFSSNATSAALPLLHA